MSFLLCGCPLKEGIGWGERRPKDNKGEDRGHFRVNSIGLIKITTAKMPL
jgi:hypothetical protein